MICLSDNTATNMLIRLCGIEQLNASFRSMGLRKTVLRRLLFDREAAARGLENTICPKEMGMLLEALFRGTFVNPEISREAVNTLLGQQVDHKLNGKLCGAVPIAHKTGEDENLSNDVGLVLAGEPFVICFAGHDTDVYRWEDLMRRSCWELYQAQKNSSVSD
jgi:beta-lactamase class A